MKSHPLIVDESPNCNCPMCRIIRYIKEEGCTLCCWCGTDLRNISKDKYVLGMIAHACTGEEPNTVQCEKVTKECNIRILRDLTGDMYLDICKNKGQKDRSPVPIVQSKE